MIQEEKSTRRNNQKKRLAADKDLRAPKKIYDKTSMSRQESQKEYKPYGGRKARKSNKQPLRNVLHFIGKVHSRRAIETPRIYQQTMNTTVLGRKPNNQRQKN